MGAGDVGASSASQRPVDIVGAATSAPLLLLASKALLVSCVDAEADAGLAVASIDCGFLLLLGALSGVVVRDSKQDHPKLDALIDPLMQCGLGHLFFEMVYNGVILPRQAPGATYRLTPDLWLHHVAALGCGVFTTLAGNAMCEHGLGRAFVLQGCRMAATECTSGLPVSFSQALRTKRLNGPRSLVLGATMAGSFVWRTMHSFDILREFNRGVRESREGGARGVPHAWAGRLACGTIAGGNAVWTFRIFKGIVKMLRKGKRSKARDGPGRASAASNGAPK